MAIGDPQVLDWVGDASLVVPGSVIVPWRTVIDAGGMDDTDSNTTRPDLIADSDHHDLTIPVAIGTNVLVSMKYAAGATPSTDPVIRVYGRFENTKAIPKIEGRWMELENGTGDTNVTLTTASSTDVSDGSFKWTRVRANTHVFDRKGCNRIRFVVVTAFAVSGGSAATATLEATCI